MKIYLNIFLLFLCFDAIAQKVIVSNPVSFLALGDSYTIGQSVSAQESWPAQFSSYLKSMGVQVDTTNIIAQTGWTTSNLLNALKSSDLSKKYNLVSLLIGVNNQYKGINKSIYTQEFEILLKRAIEIAGNKDRVFVLSIPDYGYTPFGEPNQSKISREIDEYNAINKAISQKYQVAYFDITEISRMGLIKPSLVASDNLHPSAEMYHLWVTLISGYITIQDLSTDLNSVEGIDIKTHLSVNQANKTATLEFSSEKFLKDINIEIYTIHGIRVAHFINQPKIEFHSENHGIYFYRAIINKSQFTGKIFIF